MPAATATAREGTFTLSLPCVIRKCTQDDLPQLEWFGLFHPHREIIRSAYDQQERGEGLMLVAEVRGFPVAQVWVDLARKRGQLTGVVWAFRVFPFLQNQGLGTRLLAAAEQALRGRGYVRAELAVEKSNVAARRFYERHGYRVTGAAQEEQRYTTPEGVAVRHTFDLWVCQKELRGGARPGDPEIN